MFWRHKQDDSSSSIHQGTHQMPTRVEEGEVLAEASSAPPDQLAHDVGETLDSMLAQVAPAGGVIAEIVLPSRSGTQIITQAIRPKDAPLLHTRLRGGQFIAWQAFSARQPRFYQAASNSEATTPAVAPSAPTRLVSSRSAFSLPLLRQGHVVGMLNLESSHADAFSPQTIITLEQQGLLERLRHELARIHQEDLSEDAVAEYLIEKMRDRIAYAISPDDMAEVSYQILGVSAGIVKPANVSAGLILVYNRTQVLTARADGETLYAVRAARLGAFNSDLEWDFSGPSIARRIITNRKGEVILDAQRDPLYRDSGTGQQNTAELIVPLMSTGDSQPSGVIGLVTTQSDNFDREHDLGRMETVAAIATSAIHRSDDYRLGKRRTAQLACADELERSLAPLFPIDMHTVTGDLIRQVRDRVSQQILGWALQYTDAQHGAFVLLQTTPQPEGEPVIELVMTDKRTTGVINDKEFKPGKLPRWAPDKGYTGRALQLRRTLIISNVYTGVGTDVRPDHYIPYFIRAQSEVATPLVIGDTPLGVLDVEADEPNHFNSDYVDWIEFLARQAAFALSVIERAAKTRVELTMADLARSVDGAIDNLRRRTQPNVVPDPVARVGIVQQARRQTLDLIIVRLRELTGAWVGRFLLELNAYGPNDQIDRQRGRLYYLASSDPLEISNQEDRFFGFDRGVSSEAFLTATRIVFNSEEQRHAKYFDSNPERKSLSGIFQPVIEGTRVTGILNLECEHEGAFTPELIQAFELAASLISMLLTGARLRIDAILSEMLRDYDFDIMRTTTSKTLDFMDRAIRSAAQLSGVMEKGGWGTLVYLRPPVGGASPSVEQLYWHDFTDPSSTTRAEQVAHAPIEYAIFRDAIATQLPVVILDRTQQPDEERRAEPWPTAARSVIAVPLLRPSALGQGDEVIGILALAHPDPGQYSDHDKRSLRLFGESIVFGITTVALIQGRARLMRQLRFDSARAATPAAFDAEAILDALDDAGQATDKDTIGQHLNEAREATNESLRNFTLAQRLTTWYLDLVDEDLTPSPTGEAQSPSRMVVNFRESAEAFAGIYKTTIALGMPEDTVLSQSLAGGEEVIRLVEAVLAQYLEYACRANVDKTISLHVMTTGPTVTFSVGYNGPVIPPEQRGYLFTSGISSGTLVSEETDVSAVQQGLFQVKRIADRLGWRAYYEADETQTPQNRLCIEVPTRSSEAAG